MDRRAWPRHRRRRQPAVILSPSLELFILLHGTSGMGLGNCAGDSSRISMRGPDFFCVWIVYLHLVSDTPCRRNGCYRRSPHNLADFVRRDCLACLIGLFRCHVFLLSLRGVPSQSSTFVEDAVIEDDSHSRPVAIAFA